MKGPTPAMERPRILRVERERGKKEKVRMSQRGGGPLATKEHVHGPAPWLIDTFCTFAGSFHTGLLVRSVSAGEDRPFWETLAR